MYISYFEFSICSDNVLVVTFSHGTFCRFKEGLAMFDFVNALEQHPSLFFLFMCYTETKLTADAVENIFQVRHCGCR